AQLRRGHARPFDFNAHGGLPKMLAVWKRTARMRYPGLAFSLAASMPATAEISSLSEMQEVAVPGLGSRTDLTGAILLSQVSICTKNARSATGLAGVGMYGGWHLGTKQRRPINAVSPELSAYKGAHPVRNKPERDFPWHHRGIHRTNIRTNPAQTYSGH